MARDFEPPEYHIEPSFAHAIAERLADVVVAMYFEKIGECNMLTAPELKHIIMSAAEKISKELGP